MILWSYILLTSVLHISAPLAIMHIVSQVQLWKLVLNGHLNTDAQANLYNFDYENDILDLSATTSHKRFILRSTVAIRNPTLAPKKNLTRIQIISLIEEVKNNI